MLRTLFEQVIQGAHTGIGEGLLGLVLVGWVLSFFILANATSERMSRNGKIWTVGFLIIAGPVLCASILAIIGHAVLHPVPPTPGDILATEVFGGVIAFGIFVILRFAFSGIRATPKARWWFTTVGMGMVVAVMAFLLVKGLDLVNANPATRANLGASLGPK